jgi:hypothetical protein
LNEIGLAKFGFPAGTGAALKGFYRDLFRQGRQTALTGSSLAEAKAMGDGEIGTLLRDFFASQRRGLLMRPVAEES